MADDNIWTGKRLESLINSPLPVREPLIEEFLYTSQALMTYAGSGTGKSVISLCGCLQGSAGHKVFGYFDVPKPLKIYYVLGERDIIEPAERMQLMRKSFNFNYNNIIIDEGVVGHNILNRKEEDWVIERIKKSMPDADFVVFDPIYSLTEGKLSNPECAGLFQAFTARTMKALKCSIWYNNHTTKSTTSVIGNTEVAKKDPFIGAEYIKAAVNVMYYVRQENGMVIFEATKNQHNTAMKKFRMLFDHETFTVKVKGESLTAKEKEDLFFLKHKTADTTFTVDDHLEALKPATPRYCQKLLGVAIKSGRITNLSAEFTKACYKVN